MLTAVSLLIVVSSLLISIILVRQLLFTGLFLFGRNTQSVSQDVPTENRNLPTVTILIPAHNEEMVIGGCLEAMQKVSYPSSKLEIVVINDRSHDRTGEIADAFAARDSRIRVFHRPDDAIPGKPAALADTIKNSTSDIFVFFDADYIPPRGLIRKLVAPFENPEVGATMGRVVPYNTDRNLLTKLIDLERRAGYVVDQNMRQRLGLLPQFGGTCGAVRRSDLEDVGGWLTDVLAEDTDLTYRLFLNGKTVAYVPDALCYEESPEDWRVRFKQVRRWSYGHNDCLLRYFVPVLLTRKQGFFAKLDAAIVLLFFAVPTLAMMTLFVALLVPTITSFLGPLVFLAPGFAVYCSFGNFAPYFQIAAGCAHDKQPLAFLAAPVLYLSSFVSMAASVAGLFWLLRDRIFNFAPRWDKTVRFRLAEPTGAAQK